MNTLIIFQRNAVRQKNCETRNQPFLNYSVMYILHSTGLSCCQAWSLVLTLLWPKRLSTAKHELVEVSVSVRLYLLSFIIIHLLFSRRIDISAINRYYFCKFRKKHVVSPQYFRHHLCILVSGK